MTDRALLAKKLAEIETFLAELATLARPERIETDLKEARFVLYTLQMAIQAALDAASHIVSEDRLGEPETNRALFDLLVKGGWIEAELATKLREMAGFRNLLVHGYAGVKLHIVRDIIERHLGDLRAFVARLRQRLGEE